jgi:hypothetical protein
MCVWLKLLLIHELGWLKWDCCYYSQLKNTTTLSETYKIKFQVSWHRIWPTHAKSYGAPVRHRGVVGVHYELYSLLLLPVVYITQPGETFESLARAVLADVCIATRQGTGSVLLQPSALNKRTARIACVCPLVQDSIYFSYGSVTFNIVTTNHDQSDLPHRLKSSLCLINFDITSWAEITQSIYWLGWMTKKSWFNSRKEQKISLLQTI